MKIYQGRYPGKKSKKTERKIDIRIDYWDTWNLAENLALIIHPALVRLKEIKHGAPDTDDEDVPEELRSTNAAPKKNEWDTDSLHFVRWNWILDEMIWAFSQLNIDWEDQYWSGKSDRYFEELPETLENGEKLYEWKEGPLNTLKCDYEARKVHGDRIQNGLRLFGKYYLSLWD